MIEESVLSGTASGHSALAKKIHQIFANNDERTTNQVTNLLIKALLEGDQRSRSALSEFVGLPMTSAPEAEIDFVLLQQARLFINGPNAHRVQNWISSYQMSIPFSQHRLICESILRTFVASRSAIEKMKWQVMRARSLANDAQSKCDALKVIISKMPK